jgi:serine/threonine-protein kinase HipA
MSACLYCYQPLADDLQDFHPGCAKKFFGDIIAPVLPYSEDDFETLAKQVVENRITVPGVQPKISLHLNGGSFEGSVDRFTLVGLWGGYILKPPTRVYPELPEVEDVTMHLAHIAKIKTVPHSLIRLKSGNLAYITRRVDRVKKSKLAMEDMCQLTERLTEDKYHGSYEQIGKAILKYSSLPGLDLVNYWEVVVFSFLTGNADMHLKNFSLLENPSFGMCLSPAYDLVNTSLVNPSDNEELALTLNGKKRKLRKSDFISAMISSGLEEKQIENIFKKLARSVSKWNDFIDLGFMSTHYRDRYKEIISDRVKRLS